MPGESPPLQLAVQGDVQPPRHLVRPPVRGAGAGTQALPGGARLCVGRAGGPVRPALALSMACRGLACGVWKVTGLIPFSVF